MQHERVGLSAEFGHDELHAMAHEPRDEVHVSGESVKLGDQNRRLRIARSLQRCGELRPAMERIGA
jgi:hypothetical protein